MSLPPRMKLKFHSSKDFANLIVSEEISKRTPPLGYAFADFSRKRKVSASVGGMSPRNQKIDETLVMGRSRKISHSTSKFCVIAPENLDKLDSPLGKSRGGNAPSLPEVKEPEGSLCILAYFLYTRK